MSAIIALIAASLDIPDFISALEPAFDDLVAGKSTEAEVKAAIVTSLDVLVDWSHVVPGAGGQVIEAADGPAIQKAVDWLFAIGHSKAKRKAAVASGAAKPGIAQFFAHLFHPQAS